MRTCQYQIHRQGQVRHPGQGQFSEMDSARKGQQMLHQDPRFQESRQTEASSERGGWYGRDEFGYGHRGYPCEQEMIEKWE